MSSNKKSLGVPPSGSGSPSKSSPKKAPGFPSDPSRKRTPLWNDHGMMLDPDHSFVKWVQRRIHSVIHRAAKDGYRIQDVELLISHEARWASTMMNLALGMRRAAKPVPAKRNGTPKQPGRKAATPKP